VHRRRVAADVVAAREERNARGRLAAAEDHRIVGGGIASKPIGVQLAILAAVVVRRREIVKSDVIIPAPTAQPQRVAVSAWAECPRRETPAPPRPARKRASGWRTSAARLDPASASKSLHLGGDVDRKAARVEEADLRAAAPAGEERIPRRRDVVADRRDEADAGDRYSLSDSL
jgi:hypothetical protein